MHANVELDPGEGKLMFGEWFNYANYSLTIIIVVWSDLKKTVYGNFGNFGKVEGGKSNSSFSFHSIW